MSWVFCAGMIRSGSTLQYQLAASIVEEGGTGRRVPYAPEAEFDRVKGERAGAGALRLVFKAHVCAPPLAETCLNEGALVIYSYRDIRDVAVSAARKFGRSFSELCEGGWLDQAVDDYYKWRSMPLTMVSRYEEMRDDVEGEAERINAFLGSPLDPQRARAIGSGYGLEQQRRRVQRVREDAGGHLDSRDVVFDADELLHHNHIHEGQVGAWRQLLDRAQIDYLNERYGKWLAEAGYDTR